MNIVQNFGYFQNKSIIYRPAIYDLRSRTLKFPEQEGKIARKSKLKILKNAKNSKTKC